MSKSNSNKVSVGNLKESKFRSTTGQSLKFLFGTSPFLCSLFLIFEIAFCIIPILSAKIISQIVNIFVDIQSINNDRLILIVSFYIAINIVHQIMSPVRNTVFERLSDKIAAKSEIMLNTKIALFNSVNCFEDNNFYNEMQLARNGCGVRLVGALQMMSSFLRGVITISLTAGYMLSIHWLIGAISLLAMIPNTFYNFWVAKKKEGLFRSKSESARKLAYFGSILSSPEYAKEVRLFDLSKFILHKYKTLFNSEYRRINGVRTKHCLIGVLCCALSAATNGVGLFLIIQMALRDRTNAGNIVLYISLLPQFIAGMQMLINGFAQTRDNNYYVCHFFNFLNREQSEKNGTLQFNTENIPSIEVKNISFKYPNSSQLALKNVSFSIKGPSLVAIVGENGSGKSTLIKLLMRLFDVTEGEILINSSPMQDYDINQLRSKMSGVFQDPARFSFSIRDNLLLGNIHGMMSENDILVACKKAGLEENINKLPNGIDTMLGKQFEGGTELSGGQWQKVSFARALCSQAKILFFDEASADLDPKAEQTFYKSVREFVNGKIALYITHRFSGTKDSDLILVLKDGELAEIGNHSDLLKKKGEYAKLYHAQAEGYDLVSYD